MEIVDFLSLVVPVLIVFYLGALLFIRPPRAVLFASLLGGLVVGLVNFLVDRLADSAHWWHYTFDEKTLRSTLHLSLPSLVLSLPLYVPPILVFGSLAYLLVWRFWHGRLRWLAIAFLIGVPLFCIVRDLVGGLANTAYQIWTNTPLAFVATILMWLVAFYAGFLLFWRIAGHIAPPVQEIEVRVPYTSSSSERSEEAHNHIG